MLLAMLKNTKHNLKKLETLFDELDYRIRYEKGNFQSGYCIVENRNIAVINKFFDTEGRITTLLEILDTIEIDPERLSEASLKTLKQTQKKEPKKASNESETE
jgi:hypothetical protein